MPPAVPHRDSIRYGLPRVPYEGGLSPDGIGARAAGGESIGFESARLSGASWRESSCWVLSSPMKPLGNANPMPGVSVLEREKDGAGQPATGSGTLPRAADIADGL